MQLHHPSPLARARRRGAQGLLALVAGLSMSAAWSTQIVSIGDKKVVPATPVGTSTLPAPVTSTSAPVRPASAPASAPKKH